MAAPLIRHFRLSPDPVTAGPPGDAPQGDAQAHAAQASGAPQGGGARQPLGLTCGPDGPALAGAPLLRKTETGLEPLPRDELAALTLAAYGEIGDLQRLTRGLAATAAALTRGDLPLAMTAAVHLQLPDLTPEAAARLAAVADYLAKRGSAEGAEAETN